MSADNYLFVRRWHGAYYVDQRFASCEYDERQKPTGERYITAALAVHAAFNDPAYYEYGVRVSAQVSADLQAADLP